MACAYFEICAKMGILQYCKDCKKEQGLSSQELTEIESLIKSITVEDTTEWSDLEVLSPQCPNNRVCIQDGFLYYGKERFKIIEEEQQEKNRGANKIVRTYKGLTFYLREQDDEFIFIKLVRAPQIKKSSKKEDADFKKLVKLLLGSVPEGFVLS